MLKKDASAIKATNETRHVMVIMVRPYDIGMIILEGTYMICIEQMITA